jgi:hypothetical protein
METTGPKFTKICKVCGEEKPLSSFHKHKNQSDGLRRHCKICNTKVCREFRLKSDYGLTLDSFATLLCNQGSCCSICQTSKPGGMGDWHVDHDHTDGLVRGILCSNCNTAIGKFNDNIKNLEAAIHYLQHAKQTTQAILKQTRAEV